MDGSTNSLSLQGKTLFFLIGCGRSGTTWLQTLLTRSPLVVSSNETHLFDLYFPSIHSTWERLKAAESPVGLHHILDEAEFCASVRDAMSAVFKKISQRKPEATAILEKTPSHALFGKEILGTFPDARFIHIIRDPRAVVSSLIAASRGWGKDWAPPTIERATTLWVQEVTCGRSIGSLTPNYYEVKYRDLLNDGPQTLQVLFNWMGIQATLEECHGYIEDCHIDKLRRNELTDVPWKVPPTEATEFFRAGNLNQWELDLSRRQVAVIEWLAHDLMAQLEYQASIPPEQRSWLHMFDRAIVNLRQALRWRLENWAKRL